MNYNDEEAIACYTDLAGDGVRIDYSVSGNPFRLSSDRELLSDKYNSNRRIQQEQDSIRKFSLVQRTEFTRPRVPPVETRATRILSSARRSLSSASSKNSQNFCSQELDDFAFQSQELVGNDSQPPNFSGTADSMGSARTALSNITSATTESRKTKSSLGQSTQLENSAQLSQSQQLEDTPRKRRERKPTMHEFVDEKREIYRLQLFINKKNKDIEKFSIDVEKSEKRLQDAEAKISTLGDQYKMATIQIEAAVARKRKYADAAARTTSEKRRDFHRLKVNYEILQSDLIKKEAMLETYQNYREFLLNFVPEDKTLEEYFISPSVLADDLRKIENENLFLIQECEHLVDMLNASTNPVRSSLDTTNCLHQNATDRINSIEKVEPFDDEFTTKQAMAMDAAEGEFGKITELISKTYGKCFTADSDLKPMTMLERIENKLEMMYRLEVLVLPSFIAEKEKEKMRIRRDMQRKMKQEKQAIDQKIKTDQAIERAKKPIPQKVGRPTNRRVIPQTRKLHDDEKEKQRLREIERETNLLYGPIE